MDSKLAPGLDMRRALQIVRHYPGASGLANYFTACQWLLAHRGVLDEVVHIVLSYDAGECWAPIMFDTQQHCDCGLTRLLVPQAHRPFVPGLVHPITLSQHKDVDVMPLGGSLASTLVQLTQWDGELGVVTNPYYTSSRREISSGQLRLGSVTTADITGYPLSAWLGRVEVPLGMIVEDGKGGVGFIPDAAMYAYRFSGDAPPTDQCQCKLA